MGKQDARTAGLLYLMLVVVAPLRQVYIPSQLFVSGDAAATAANIVSNAELFWLGILGDLFCATLEVFLTLALFRLFKDVDRPSAVLMTVLGLMPVPLYFVNVFNDIAVAHLLLGPDAPACFDAVQVVPLADLAMALHGAGVHMLQIFWGAWLFPLAALAWKSHLVPRPVAVWLGINGVAYLALSLTGFAAPAWSGAVSLWVLPAQLGEVAFVACLLWRGLRGGCALRVQRATGA